MSSEEKRPILENKILFNSSETNLNIGKNNFEENTPKEANFITQKKTDSVKIHFDNSKEFSFNKNQSSPSADFHTSNNENNNKYYFTSKKINEKSEETDKIYCNCTKTKCIKKYCECYASNKFCKDCNCVDCKNIPMKNNNNKNLPNYPNVKEALDIDKIICTCTKSNCTKKYCDCFKSGKKCSDKCKCINCYNSLSPTFNVVNNNLIKNNVNNTSNEKVSTNEEINIIKNKDSTNKLISNIYNNDEEKKESIKISSNKLSDIDSLLIQRVSLFISKFETLVNVEKFSEEDMKILSKKRKLM